MGFKNKNLSPRIDFDATKFSMCAALQMLMLAPVQMRISPRYAEVLMPVKSEVENLISARKPCQEKNVAAQKKKLRECMCLFQKVSPYSEADREASRYLMQPRAHIAERSASECGRLS
jgi:hypothetical protein